MSDDMDEMDGDEPLDGEEFLEYDVASELVKGLQQMIQLQAQMLQMLGAMQAQLGAPKQVVRDEMGRVIGLQPVQRGQ